MFIFASITFSENFANHGWERSYLEKSIWNVFGIFWLRNILWKCQNVIILPFGSNTLHQCQVRYPIDRTKQRQIRMLSVVHDIIVTILPNPPLVSWLATQEKHNMHSNDSLTSLCTTEMVVTAYMSLPANHASARVLILFWFYITKA